MRRQERGAVTAELALALPVLLAVTVGLVWLLSVGAAQVRTIDAARETARAVARGDDQGAAIQVGQDVAPSGARLSVSNDGETVTVHASAQVRGPGGLFHFLPAVTVEADAIAHAEESGDGVGAGESP